MARWRRRKDGERPRSTTPEPERPEQPAPEPPPVIDLTVGPIPGQRAMPTD